MIQYCKTTTQQILLGPTAKNKSGSGVFKLIIHWLINYLLFSQIPSPNFTLLHNLLLKTPNDILNMNYH